MNSDFDAHTPSQAPHPLHLLDQYLGSIEKVETERNSQGIDNKPEETKKAQENAAVILAKRREEILRVADYLYGGSSLESALSVLDTEGSVRQICATPSLRGAYLVQGTQKPGTRRSSSVDNYFCLFQPKLNKKAAFYYCSCRSFFERAKHDQSNICKHLIALMLMPHLGCSCKVELVSDSDYASMLMRLVFEKG